MDLTLRDITKLEALHSFKLLGGGGGLGRTLSKVGMLDFEFTRLGAHQCVDDQWVQGELVLSTFLYARDNPDLIVDAAKKLDSCRTAGLAIKNVFSLEIPQEAIRYADAHDYPLFVFTDHSLFFEDIIVLVSEMIRSVSDGNEIERKLGAILGGGEDKSAVKRAALEINHAFRNSFFVAYFSLKPEADAGGLAALISRGSQRNLVAPGSAVLKYGQGFFFVHSTDDAKSIDPGAAIAELSRNIGVRAANFHVGVSDVQYFLTNFKKALQQSLQASSYARVLCPAGSARYRDLGVYRLLLPVQEEEWLDDYYDAIVTPIVSYDAENRTNLLEAAMAYEACGGSIREAAARIGAHENTVRYRLAKIGELLGRQSGSAMTEELSLAMKIHRIRISRSRP